MYQQSIKSENNTTQIEKQLRYIGKFSRKDLYQRKLLMKLQNGRQQAY